MSDIQNRTKQGAKKDDYIVQGSILAAAAVLTKIIGVVYRIPLANILGDEGNGFYGYAYQVYAIALMISSFSLPTAVSKLVSIRLAKKQRRNAFRVFLCSLMFAVVVGLVISMAIFFGASLISTHAMKSPLSVYALRVLAPGLLIVAVMAVIRGYFQGMGTMLPTAISQIIEQVINAVVSIVGASVLFGIGTKAGEKAGEELLGPAYGAAGSTLGTVSGSLAGLLFLLFVIALYQKVIRKQLKRDKSKNVESYHSILKALLLTAIPVVFSTAVYNINQIIDLTIFNHVMQAQGFVEKEYMALQGIYTGKYDTLINVPMAIANAMGTSVVPSLTAVAIAGTKRQVHDKINQTMRITMVIAIPSCIGYFVLASPIMVLLYNDSSATPANLLMMGAIVVVLYGLSSVSNSILHGLNYMTSPAKNAGVALVIHLVAFVLMMTVFKMNVYALVGGNIVFALSMCILNLIKIRKVSGFRIDVVNTFGKPFAAAAVMGVVTFGVQKLFATLIGGRVIPVCISLLVAIVVYAVVLLKIGTLSEDDILDLPMGGRILRYVKKFHLLPAKDDDIRYVD
nr:polysaccharide biosynthesis protein [uncultured Mediterraneibacter sp.]